MQQNNPKLYVITGGPGSGKTTVLRELKNRGFAYLPEVARQIIQEQVETGGDALPWTDRQRYTELMLERSVESYCQCAPAAEPMFSDRGIPDSLCYARLIGLTELESLRRACEQYRYARQVFFAPAWREIYETDTERRQGFADALRTAELMQAVYEELGYEIIELPKATVAERADFILTRIGDPR